MSVLSTNPRKEVKHKDVAFPIFPDPGNLQLKIPPAEQSAEPAQAQDLQKSDPGARAGSGLELDLPVKAWPGRYSKGYSKKSCLHALMFTHQGRDDQCDPSLDTLAKEMGLGSRQVIRIRKQLELDGDVRVVSRDRPNCYWIRRYTMVRSILWVDPGYVVKSGLSINRALLLAFIRRRALGNDDMWFKNQEVVEALGVCRRTVQLLLHGFAAEHILQITERPGRGSGGNLYTLTGYGRSIIGVSEPEQKAQKCHPKEKGSKEEKLVDAPSGRRGAFSPESGLSNDPKRDQEVYRLLQFGWVHPKVARPMAFDWRDDLQSVRNTIINTAYRFEADAETLRRHNLAPVRGTRAGYIVGTLDGAQRERHGVKLSKLAREGEARRQGSARAAAAGRPTESEFERRKKEAKRALRMPPAKPHTPYADEKLALIAQKRDKEADDALLTRTLAAARSRSWQYRKYANLPQKAGFLVDPCH